ncbi:RHS repeat-associated protein [Clostridium pascui]|nr:RHS repeat-associated protein [Clostridium pascui]
MTNVTTHVGYKNPYRYRGYRYDDETQLYYLQSRYYDPSWGRFINADDVGILHLTQGELLGANLFSYCVNNPINNMDPSGLFAMRVSDVTGLIDTIITAIPFMRDVSRMLKYAKRGGKLTDVLSGFYMETFKLATEKVVGRLGLQRSIAGKLFAVMNEAFKNMTGISAGSLITYGLTRIFPTVIWKVRKYWYWGPIEDTKFIIFSKEKK